MNRTVQYPLTRPLYPSDGFIDFCRMQIRKGLMIRYWITLPVMYRRELQFRREFESALQNAKLSGQASRERLVSSVIVYRGFLRDTECAVDMRHITPEIGQIECIECGGTGRWDFGPTPSECGPCAECKGTGLIFVS